jgi:molybdopterin converting factor subunit 1
MKKVQVLYFAALRDLAGHAEEGLELGDEIQSVGELVLLLSARHPGLRLDGVRLAKNEEFTDANAPLESGDVIALIPPVSGG